MSVRKIYLRYFPPGIALEFVTERGDQRLRHIDLFELKGSGISNLSTCATTNAHVDDIVSSILADNELYIQQINNEAVSSSSLETSKHPLLPSPACNAKKHNQGSTSSTSISLQTDTFTAIKHAIKTLQRKLCEPRSKKFYLFKCLQQHILPLTNVCFDRSGERYLTCSYDRTCRIFHKNTGNELQVLRGHENVVFMAGFNFPKCDKLVTSSFDGTAKVWNCTNSIGGVRGDGSDAKLNDTSPDALCTLCGHSAEVVSAEFHPLHALSIATASLDGTARIFDIETSLELLAFDDHNAEVIASRFSRTNENLVLTGSFDRTAVVRDIRQECAIAQLRGHTAELSNCIWNYDCKLIATASLDGTARIWDIRNLESSIFVIKDHNDEVLDLCFDYTGKLLATCSSDCTARVWKTNGEFCLLSVMSGHADEVSKVCFSPPGGLLLTASADQTARLWVTETGECFQALTGHEAEVFSCAFNYAGDAIITASKDNTCRLWR